MQIVSSPARLTRLLCAERTRGRSIGFVPTLGCLHEGHAALIRRALKENRVVAVSLFVNPLQFRLKAYRAYPRDAKKDLLMLQELGVHYVFTPTPEKMYPAGFDTKVEIGELVHRLEGKAIRWHYRGVTTVVAKLFNIVQPDRAYFGRKDPHQLALLQRMVKDLNFRVKIVPVSTRRARDGVALSSRNTLLTPQERKAAAALPRAIAQVERKLRLGAASRRELTKMLRQTLEAEPLVTVDFAAVVDAESLREDVFGAQSLIYAAVVIGGKRLTDNKVVKNPKPAAG